MWSCSSGSAGRSCVKEIGVRTDERGSWGEEEREKVRGSDEILRCTGLSAFELQHGHADGQEQHDPRNGGHETQVHVGFQQVPAAGEDAPQRCRGHGQRQTVADVPQQDRHALHRPDDA